MVKGMKMLNSTDPSGECWGATPAELCGALHNLLDLVFQPDFNPLHLSNPYFVSLSVTLLKTLSFVRK